MPTYTGNNGSNTINGSNGDDTISGLGGDDTLNGGNGNDTVSGGTGNDSIDGGNGNDTLSGDGGNDTISGGNGNDAIDGGDGSDTISGGNGDDVIAGGAGNDTLTGDNGDDRFTGGGGDDIIDGSNGNDRAFFSGFIAEYSFYSSGGYLHIVHLGGAGADGHDQVKRVERFIFLDRTIVLGTNNAPVAVDDHVLVDEDSGTYSSGAASVKDNDYDFEGQPLTVTPGIFSGTYGTLTLHANGTYSYTLFASAQALAQGENVTDSFTYTVSDGSLSDTANLVITVAGRNDAPVAAADTATTAENAALFVNVLANDTDVDHGAVLTVTAASAPAGQGTASVVGNQVAFDPGTDFDDLAVGESEVVVVSYDIVDEHGATASSTITVTVTGSNDGPVANPDTGTTDEDTILLVDVLANDTDVDNGATLTVTAASAPAGQGTASVVGNQVAFDPGTDFDDLAVGESEVVVVSYDIEDEQGATASSTITVTVTGTNDGPVANPDTGTTDEDTVLLVDVLANDTDVDNGAVLTVTAASVPAGQGSVAIVGNQVRFDPGSDFDYLAAGESVVVNVDYTIEDEHGAQSLSTLTITVEGREDVGVVIIGTDDGETLTGTPGDDTITALGGDDIVFGQSGADLINGGDGADSLYGEGGNDVIEGGNDDDLLSGGNGNDQLSGQAGNDSILGEDGNDQLSGGDGFDQLYGDAGDDVIQGGNDDDILSGGDGNDQLLGQSGNDGLFGESGNDQLSGGDGNDSLDGGDGDDVLTGGDGDDFLGDSSGTNSLAGGLGDDLIVASASTGAQTIDGGDDNDSIYVSTRYFASTITTGTGSDTIALLHADRFTDPATLVTVTDFTAGAGGDMFQLSGGDGTLLTLLEGWDGNSNPFGSGFLRLEQSGADTLFQWDQDGAAGGAAWQTLVVFENSSAAAFTGANFTPGYSPDGSAPAGETITGTDDDDNLTGTIGDDTINALGGVDFVNGGAGADQINGGDGNDFLSGDAGDDVIDGGNDGDTLSGGDGNDQLFGQSGNDGLFGESGNDQLSGGDGNDSLDGGDGDDVLTGGDGDDFLGDSSGTNSLAGGLGDDLIVASASTGAQTIDGGDDNDSIYVSTRYFASTITTGTGSDTIALLHADRFTDPATLVTVTDFTAGAGGDMFQLSGGDGTLLTLLEGWDGNSNPFGSGFLRLEQSGADTLFQWDQDGAAGGAAWQTLVVFENSSAAAFTGANFTPGYSPDGSAPAGETITGTDDDDNLTGTIGDDTINALGGVDFVNGGAGADQINGGDGNDFLSGEGDNDVIDGGNDDDTLSGGDGNDQLFGQSGNDGLFGESGNDQMSGGSGNDSLDGGDGDDVLTGGDGDDFLGDSSGTNDLAGGLGDDLIIAAASTGAQTIDGGDGNDTIRISARTFASTITTGTGSDTIALLHADLGAAAIAVTDFTAGDGGDMLQLSGDDGALLSLLEGWDSNSNPFGSGFLRLEQSGADTLFQWDQDGAAGGAAWQTLVIFENTDAATFTEANFVPGYSPDGAAPVGETITGTDDDDSLTGTIGDDTINALGGVDLVNGGAGADQINGGDGSDFLSGEGDNDVIDGGNDDDTLWGGDGNDQLFGQSGNDGLFGESGNDQMSGGDGNDSLEGGGGDDVLDGGDSDDFLAGGDGSDVLTGGAGSDAFNFQLAAQGPDEITDFVSGIDKIRVTADGFGGGLTAGDSVVLTSGANPTASNATGQFLFDTDDGRLLWDADGTGSGAAVLVATLSNVPTLVASDFIVG